MGEVNLEDSVSSEEEKYDYQDEIIKDCKSLFCLPVFMKPGK